MGRRKPSSDGPINIDSDSKPEPESDLKCSVSGIYNIDEMSKHRTCWMHVLAFSKAQRQSLGLRETEEIKKISPCFLTSCPHRRRSVRSFKTKYVNLEVSRKTQNQESKACAVSRRKPVLVSRGCRVSRRKQELDSGTFQCYFESLWKSFSEDKKTSFTYLDCIWFSLYIKPTTKDKVLTWIKKKHIFSKKYVFVPIVCWSHWNLLILCHFGENLESKTQRPCMLLLDSLEMADPRRLEPDIRKFVVDIFREEGRPENMDLLRKIPLLVPKVPQQRNDQECGNFVLYFINLFMESAPQTFSMEEYPYFMKKNWFAYESLDCFCQDIYSSAK
ncbi:PREDICTED: probable ubiquitin-like-specific protease 2A [Fragaria vesca subsp. vesca]|uniref:probable ubiquitin-like-specific protease 2A n=1 Tax=Fragaria vesca subsp. vesca TaxID=101020 RepID=UPI0002C34C19|nr:PREDICTED: probable ubiquitin-like-specific protease 2A [Fragaria vesca subsp. vesca]